MIQEIFLEVLVLLFHYTKIKTFALQIISTSTVTRITAISLQEREFVTSSFSKPVYGDLVFTLEFFPLK